MQGASASMEWGMHHWSTGKGVSYTGPCICSCLRRLCVWLFRLPETGPRNWIPSSIIIITIVQSDESLPFFIPRSLRVNLVTYTCLILVGNQRSEWREHCFFLPLFSCFTCTWCTHHFGSRWFTDQTVCRRGVSSSLSVWFREMLLAAADRFFRFFPFFPCDLIVTAFCDASSKAWPPHRETPYEGN